MSGLSFSRLYAMLIKEFLQMRRDRGTIGITVMLPIVQLFLFGYAINTNPRHLPTALLSADHSAYERSLTFAMVNSSYFDLRDYTSEKAVDQALNRGDILFAMRIPPNFARSVDRGESPEVLVEADSTDPVATASATAAMVSVAPNALTRDLPPNMRQAAAKPPFTVTLHNKYNPEQITALNIVPGLIGVILSFSTLVVTTLAITREREAGTLENLLAMPASPLEVMLGKIIPYIGLGYVQVTVILLVATLVFHVPVAGPLPLLVLALGVFIACNLSIGFTLSSLATTQMQAQQLAMFVLLPSMLLGGFLFPFAGMPPWAQDIGQVLPLTHILRICRGILLKGNSLPEVWPDLWPMGLFALVVGTIAVRSYRQTLD
jgi:ABC-2 type transport system permease protein